MRYSYPGSLVVRALKIVSLERGLPERFRVDNGPEFIGSALAEFCEARGVALDFIEPGSPQQNVYVERFNRTFREDILDANAFMTLAHAQELTDALREDYNRHHPHSSLGDASPLAYRESHHEESPAAEAVKAKMNASALAPAALTASPAGLIAV